MAELQLRMSSGEFAEWLAFQRMSPWDAERADLRTALICMVTANTHKGRKGKAYALVDFLLRFRPKRLVAKTQDEIAIKLKSWMSMMKSLNKEK